jgi:hypothetical protein
MHQKINKFRLTLITGMILHSLSACKQSLFGNDGDNKFEYTRDPNEIIIFENHNSIAGGGWPEQACNTIPDSRIWGDGRAVVLNFMNVGGRSVYTGKSTRGEIEDILNLLDNLNLLNPPSNTINEAGTGYSVCVRLNDIGNSSFWSEKTEIYSTLINVINVDVLEVFTPESLYPVIGPKEEPRYGKYPEWLGNLPFSLPELEKEGRVIGGEAL